MIHADNPYDESILLIQHLKLDLFKELYEGLGIDYGETHNDLEYYNYLAENPLVFSTGSGLDGGEMFSGSFASISSALSEVNVLDVAGFKKYAAGGYCNNIISEVTMRLNNLKSIPVDFLNASKIAAQQNNIPVQFYILLGASESGFRDCPTNKSGYGGYFGQIPSLGYGLPFEVQARRAAESYHAAAKASPGANATERLVLGYIYHHLPAVALKYWNKSGGKIWSTNPDYIYQTVSSCWNGPKVTMAEALTINVSAQFLAKTVSGMQF